MLECVVNISEGRDRVAIDAVAAAGGSCLLDVHSDPHHHRSVLTLAGPDADVEEAARAVTTEGVARIDLSVHTGAHPRRGAVDVVPFVPLAGAALDRAVAARDRFAAWAPGALGVPCLIYGPERTLPEVRRMPHSPHPTAGVICVGARPVLIAYNLWLAPDASLDMARRAATEVRGKAVRSLALQVGTRLQVSLNLIDPPAFGPADAYDAVAALVPVEQAELVGLLPAAVLASIPEGRWAALDLAADRTIEARLGLR